MNLLPNCFLIVSEIEIEVASQIKLKKEFISLLTTPGIGNILGLTIMLEVGTIGRFPKLAITLHIADALKVKEFPMARKKAKIIRKRKPLPGLGIC